MLGWLIKLFFVEGLNFALNIQNNFIVLMEPTITDSWSVFRNIAIALLSIPIVVYGVMNIFNVQRSTYGITKLIPKLVITMFMVVYSKLIVQFFLELAGGLQAAASPRWATVLPDYADTIGSSGSTNLESIFVLTGTYALAGPLLGFAKILLGIIILFLIIGSGFTFTVMLSLRLFFLYFLTVIAPLAMVSQLLPWTKGWYDKWWKTFFQWLFLGPIIIIYTSLGAEFMTKGWSKVIGANPLASFLELIMAAVIFGSAPIVAWKTGGALTKGIEGYAKKGANMVMEDRGVKGAFSKFMKAPADLGGRERRERAIINKVKENSLLKKIPIISSKLNNIDTEKLKQEEQKLRLEEIKTATGGDYERLVAGVGSVAENTDQEAAYLRLITEGKFIDYGNQALVGRILQTIARGGTDGAIIMNNIRANHDKNFSPSIMTDIDASGRTHFESLQAGDQSQRDLARKLKEDADRKVSTTKVADYTPPTVKYAATTPEGIQNLTAYVETNPLDINKATMQLKKAIRDALANTPETINPELKERARRASVGIVVGDESAPRA